MDRTSHVFFVHSSHLFDGRDEREQKKKTTKEEEEIIYSLFSSHSFLCPMAP
jgi:hypothetical protein